MKGDTALTPKEVIRAFLAERCDVAPERLTDAATLRDLDLDSMMLLEVMMEVEDRFGVKLGDLSLPPNPTLGDIAGCIEQALPASRPS